MVDQQALSTVMDDFARTVTGEFSLIDILELLARSAVRVLPVDGAGVMVARDDDLLHFAFSTGGDGAFAMLERLQDQTQSGPCRDCHDSGETVVSRDLALGGDWPEYQRRATEAGVHAVMALPLQARGNRWGVLDLYQLAPGGLDEEETAAAWTLANIATSYLVVTADRDTARQAQVELAHRAMHDVLTGLPMRWVFLEQLQHGLDTLRRRPGHIGVLFLDLDGLKYVNDTYGHLAGDALLATCATRIRAALRPADIVARVGGDEFVVLLESISGSADAERVAERVLVELAAPYRPDGRVLQPSASIGIAVTEDPATNSDTLISHADAAMYDAKRRGRGRAELFDPAAYAASRTAAHAREDLTSALRAALRDGQLRLHYQPIIDLRDRGTHAVEALARWQHPERGLLPAEAFIGAAETSGVINDIAAWALETACRQLVEWDAVLGDRAPRHIFVNVSSSDLTGPDLPGTVARTLATTGLAAARLTLELTESGLVSEPRAVSQSVAALRRMGCELAIDDFGTGYSSLSRLVQIPATTLKVDRSFTGQLLTHPEAATVVSAVINLGQSLHRAVVVEGVEDAATLAALRAMGCTLVQGYHLAVPMAADDLLALLSGTAAVRSA